MRLVVQRVLRAAVSAPGRDTQAIGPGLLVLAAVARGDGFEEAAWLARRTAALRIFDDAAGRMNAPLDARRHAVLAVSQFTLYADCRRGNRPSYLEAAPPETARTLYETYLQELRGAGVTVRGGWFGEHMVVSLENDGPVTIILERRGPAPA